MPVEVVYSPEAVRDLDAIWEWIAMEHGEPRAADHVIGDLLDRVDELAECPLLASPLDAIRRIKSDWRFVVAHGYLAFFRVHNDCLYVDRVLSGKSDYLRKLFGVEEGSHFYQ